MSQKQCESGKPYCERVPVTRADQEQWLRSEEGKKAMELTENDPASSLAPVSDPIDPEAATSTAPKDIVKLRPIRESFPAEKIGKGYFPSEPKKSHTPSQESFPAKHIGSGYFPPEEKGAQSSYEQFPADHIGRGYFPPKPINAELEKPDRSWPSPLGEHSGLDLCEDSLTSLIDSWLKRQHHNSKDRNPMAIWTELSKSADHTKRSLRMTNLSDRSFKITISFHATKTDFVFIRKNSNSPYELTELTRFLRLNPNSIVHDRCFKPHFMGESYASRYSHHNAAKSGYPIAQGQNEDSKGNFGFPIKDPAYGGNY